MQVSLQEAPVVSARIYALILTSPRLATLLLPEGLLTSPYEILDYDALLILHDPYGVQATFRRTQRIRFLQTGVGAILDHAWGDGVQLTTYDHDAGSVTDLLRDRGRRHLVITLKRPAARGETLTFGVARTAIDAFTEDEEWLETTIDHPIRQLRRAIVFPKARPCLQAVLHGGAEQIPLPVIRQADGTTLVRFEVTPPDPDTSYTIHWTW